VSFEEARKDQLAKWLRRDGEGYTGAFGERQNEQVEELREAVKARYPGPALEEGLGDALQHIGRERKIFRFPGEADEAYAARLERAHLYWYWGGTKAAMYNVVEPFDDSNTPPTETWFTTELDGGGGGVLLNRHEPSTSGKLAVVNNCEGPVAEETQWSAYAMAFDSRLGPWTTGPDWDEWSWDDQHLWNSSMTVQEARYLLLSILGTKSVISYPIRLGLWLYDITAIQASVPYPGYWNYIGDWDGGFTWGATPVRDTPYLTIGHVWQEHAGQGGWINDAPPHTYLVWDGGWKWGGYENPLLFGLEDA
jgi:hypothetical protein